METMTRTDSDSAATAAAASAGSVTRTVTGTARRRHGRDGHGRRHHDPQVRSSSDAALSFVATVATVIGMPAGRPGGEACPG